MSNITNLKCVVCGQPIEVGEPLLANKTGELAHQKCVEERHPSPKAVANILIGAVLESTPERLVMPEPCVMPSPPKVCSECGEPCIGACPICRSYVCQAYGYNNKFCGARHETKCPEAAKLRTPTKKPVPIELVTAEFNPKVDFFVGPNGNGHKPTKKNGKRRR